MDDEALSSFAVDDLVTVLTTTLSGCERIALQIPDALLGRLAQPLLAELTRRLKNEGDDEDAAATAAATGRRRRRLCVLGDTAYGSCCVDEVAAEHFAADVIVHFGHACLSLNSRLPVLFVFGSDNKLDVRDCAEKIVASLGEAKETTKVVLVNDVRFEYAMPDLLRQLQDASVSCSWSPLEIEKINGVYYRDPKTVSPRVEDPETIEFFGRTLPSASFMKTTSSTFKLVFIGPANDIQLTQLVLRYHEDLQSGGEANSSFSLDVYDPITSNFGPFEKTTMKTLARRFYLVQRAKDASIFGILVGTMGVSGFREALSQVQRQIQEAGKKSYTFIMGKINPQKLANFPDIDVYVIVACPYHSLIDSKDFPKPIVTPLELCVALGGREWTSGYSTSFAEAFAQEKSQFNDDGDDDSNEPHFSLVSGKMISSSLVSKKEQEQISNSSSSNALAKKTSTHITLHYSSPAGDLLQKKTFTGLEQNIGDKAPAAAVPGKTGVARGLKSLNENDAAALR